MRNPPLAGRDPALAPLRSAPVPDTFEGQMARLRARPPRRTSGPARALALTAALVVVGGACALPVDVARSLGYAVQWTVAGVADESHPSAEALAEAVPPADQLLTAVEADEGATAFRSVVTGPPPDLTGLRKAEGVSDVRVEPLVEPVRVPLGAWIADRLGAPEAAVVGLGSPRLTDAEVHHLLRRQLAATGLDTTVMAVSAGRDRDGRRTLRVRMRTAEDGVSRVFLPIGPDTRVRTWDDGVVVIEGLPPGFRPDTAALGGKARIVWRDPTGRGRPTRAQLDSLLRASGHDALADSLRRRAGGPPR